MLHLKLVCEFDAPITSRFWYVGCRRGMIEIVVIVIETSFSDVASMMIVRVAAASGQVLFKEKVWVGSTKQKLPDLFI